MVDARVQLGQWAWDRTSNELRAGPKTVRLQDRAARTLNLLVDRQGEVVSREEIVAAVWDGRAISDNSLPMVIGQLRKALDEGTGDGASIETIPKRGYRLSLPGTTPEGNPPPGAQRTRAPWFGIGLTIAAILLAVLIVRSDNTAEVVVPPIRDETGDPAYAPLARATDALLVSRIVRRGFTVSRTPGGGGVIVSGKLVLWDGRPFLSLQAVEDGKVVWSAMIDSAGGGFPANLDPKLAEWSERRAD